MTPARVVSCLVAACAAAVIEGCATGPDSPQAALAPRPFQAATTTYNSERVFATRPVIAVALGGGGLRGFAHIGVLRALEELNVAPDLIVGTSAGAVVGAAYASGLTPDQIQSLAMDLKISSLIDFTLSSRGLIRGNKLEQWIGGVTGNTPVEAFPRRFAAVATDLQSGRAVLLESGAAGAVVRASSAVPGMNIPVPYAGGHLVDGGVTSLVPVRAARALGADVVIAVDIYCNGAGRQSDKMAAVIGSVMRTQSCLLAKAEIVDADVLVSPVITETSVTSKDTQRLAIQAGYDATRTAIAQWRSRQASGSDSR